MSTLTVLQTLNALREYKGILIILEALRLNVMLFLIFGREDNFVTVCRAEHGWRREECAEQDVTWRHFWLFRETVRKSAFPSVMSVRPSVSSQGFTLHFKLLLLRQFVNVFWLWVKSYSNYRLLHEGQSNFLYFTIKKFCEVRAENQETVEHRKSSMIDFVGRYITM